MAKEELFEIRCPCCSARLTISVTSRSVVHFEPPESKRQVKNLDDALQRMKEEAKKRESLFEKTLAAEKAQKDILEKRFDELLKKASRGPVEPTKRDIDLD